MWLTTMFFFDLFNILNQEQKFNKDQRFFDRVFFYPIKEQDHRLGKFNDHK
ncbi:MAG: hypothetical protein K0R08_1166 [Solimicrobium sp.]|jgi:hypothetical protein|nr:hypothetical protein [Solimicrobium sp.]